MCDKARVLLWLSLAVLAGIPLFGVLFWAGTGDPFRRVEFGLKAAGRVEARGTAVFTKPRAKFPVVVFLHDSGGSVVDAGRELRRLAELGVAAIGLEYDQRDQAALEEQIIALNRYLEQQPWALPKATAWVGDGLGAERALNLAFRRPDLQPRLIVAVGSGSVAEVDGSEHSTFNIQHPASNQPVSSILNPHLSRRSPAKAEPSTTHCPVLLVHGGQDEVFPLKECERLAEDLRGAGVPVTLRVLPQLGHTFGEERGVVMRAVAEYCAERLPLADYTRGSSRREGALTDQSQIANRKWP